MLRLLCVVLLLFFFVFFCSEKKASFLLILSSHKIQHTNFSCINNIFPCYHRRNVCNSLLLWALYRNFCIAFAMLSSSCSQQTHCDVQTFFFSYHIHHFYTDRPTAIEPFFPVGYNHSVSIKRSTEQDD